jgi:hypothetical protein
MSFTPLTPGDGLSPLFLMRLLSLQIVFVCADLVPPLFKYLSRLRFYRIVIQRTNMAIGIVFFSTFMIGVSSGMNDFYKLGESDGLPS